MRSTIGAPIEAQRSGFDGERNPSEMSEPCPQDRANDMELGATMRKVFKVELDGHNGVYTKLTLPATPWAMLDALEKLWLAEGEAPVWEILQSDAFPGVSMYLDQKGTLSELNALAQRLAALDEQELAIVEGLAIMEREQSEKSRIPLPRTHREAQAGKGRAAGPACH